MSAKKTTEKPKHGYGVIYVMKNKINGKCYVGQANNYVSGNRVWGFDGRIQSHFAEAFGNAKDHCRLLNNAIRKYGRENFENTCLGEFLESELNDKEIHYVDKYNAYVPNGYNLTMGGGKNFQISDETRKKQSLAKKGIKRPKTKESIIIGNIIRNLKTHPTLESYIVPMNHKKSKCIGYKIYNYPTRQASPEYICEKFQNKSDPNEALIRAKKRLEELVQEYGDYVEYVKELAKKVAAERVKKTKYQIELAKCPKYVFPIVENNKLNGYYVDDVPDVHGGTHPKFMCNDLASNSKNKQKAIRHIKHLEVVNKDAKFDESSVQHGAGKSKLPKTHTKLPMYITYIKNSAGNLIGYMINRFPLKDGGHKQRKFCDTHIPMEEKYKQALAYLEQLKKENE